MKLPLQRSTIAFGLCACLTATAISQEATDAVRVNVTVNPDGSRTTYQFDQPNHNATATITEPDGKLRSKIRYQLDDNGRFANGLVFGPDGKLRFKSTYKYDGAGRMEEETQLGKDGKVRNKIVYAYDANGKQTGYSTFDEKGKLIGHVDAPSAGSATPAKK
jgi:hypothetical protein